MNSHTARALVKDAFYQVLDNKVFRILILMTIVLIAPTFLVAFTPEKVSVLFGWWTFDYSDLGWLTGLGGRSTGNANVLAIQQIQSLFVSSLAGSFGISLCLAATSFFVPRMLEKGEADTLFSKPTGRFVLLFARYVSGLLFVGALAFVLVLGMHLGLLLRSGYSDPGFLWSAVTLVYTFALIHAFSTMVGVITRSAVTALLVSILFFGFNSCVHTLWTAKEFGLEIARAKASAAAEEGGNNDIEEAINSPVARFFAVVVDVVHYPLPKTSDADVLTRKLRTVVAGREFELQDPAGKLSVMNPPADFVRDTTEREADLSHSTAVWIAKAEGLEVARITLARHTRVSERKIGDKTRTVRMSGSAAASELVKQLEGKPSVDGKPVKARDAASNGPVRDVVRWKEKVGDRFVAHQRAFLAVDDWMFEIDVSGDAAWLDEHAHKRAFSDFLEELRPQRDSAADFGSQGLGEWYETRFGWTSPIRFNAFFSLATSIAFALLMLGIARWRLSRIDF